MHGRRPRARQQEPQAAHRRDRGGPQQDRGAGPLPLQRACPSRSTAAARPTRPQRLKYRYLDLRNPAVKQNIILRCQVVAALRAAMTEHGFLEITTPILTASSPEGARDYLVPARKHPGKFYALPQAPQQFKQLLMTSGFDRYFQIAPCFRDEDARGDRSPGEFYQLDMEMAFATQDDVFAVLEDVLPPIFAKYGTYNVASSAPFRRIPYNDAMETYGSDKPDLRIDLTLQGRHRPVRGQRASSRLQRARPSRPCAVSDCALTRKQIDKLLHRLRGAVRQQGLLVQGGRERRAGRRHRQVRRRPRGGRAGQGLGLKPGTPGAASAAGDKYAARSPPACCVKTLRRRLRRPHGQGALRVLLDRGLPHVRDRRRVRRAGVLPQPVLHAQRRSWRSC